MNEICAIMGIPGKLDVDGSQVVDLYDNNQIKDIRNYCETDVANTYLLYLIFQMHTGSLSKENFIKCCMDLKEYLEKFEDKKHFQEFLREWKKVDTKNLF